MAITTNNTTQIKKPDYVKYSRDAAISELTSVKGKENDLIPETFAGKRINRKLCSYGTTEAFMLDAFFAILTSDDPEIKKKGYDTAELHYFCLSSDIETVKNSFTDNGKLNITTVRHLLRDSNKKYKNDYPVSIENGKRIFRTMPLRFDFDMESDSTANFKAIQRRINQVKITFPGEWKDSNHGFFLLPINLQAKLNYLSEKEPELFYQGKDRNNKVTPGLARKFFLWIGLHKHNQTGTARLNINLPGLFREIKPDMCQKNGKLRSLEEAQAILKSLIQIHNRTVQLHPNKLLQEIEEVLPAGREDFMLCFSATQLGIKQFKPVKKYYGKSHGKLRQKSRKMPENYGKSHENQASCKTL